MGEGIRAPLLIQSELEEVGEREEVLEEEEEFACFGGVGVCMSQVEIVINSS